MAQVRVWDIPVVLACSMLTRIANFCSSSSQPPPIFPTNPLGFFSKHRQFNGHLCHYSLLFLELQFQGIVIVLADALLAAAGTVGQPLQGALLLLSLDPGQDGGIKSFATQKLSQLGFSALGLKKELELFLGRKQAPFFLSISR
jgi:hypothetical protein